MKTKTISILIILILLPVLCWAGALQEKHRGLIQKKNVVASTPCQGANPADCTYRETFDGAVSCDGDGDENCIYAWTVVGGTITDWSSTEHILQGTNSAKLGASAQIHTGAITAADEYYSAAYVYIEALPGSTQPIMELRNSFNERCYMKVGSSGNWYVASNGGTEQTSAGTLSISTAYYIKIRAKKGTGANAECEGWVSTNGTTWGTSLLSNDGTWTDQLGRRYISTSSASAIYHFDDVRTYTGDISW